MQLLWPTMPSPGGTRPEESQWSLRWWQGFVDQDGTVEPLLGFQVQSFIVFQHTSSIHPKMGGISNVLAQSKDMYDIYIYMFVLYYVNIYTYLNLFTVFIWTFSGSRTPNRNNHFQPRAYGVFVNVSMLRFFSFLQESLIEPQCLHRKFSEHQEGHMFIIGQVRCDHQQTFTFDWHPGWGKSLIILAVLAKIEKKSNLPKTGRDMDMSHERR